MSSKPKALVLYGDGINCEAETKWALDLAGFESKTVHTSEFLENPKQLFDAQLLAFPGGFAFGDEIASGKVLAVKIKHQMIDTLHSYIDGGGLVIGICNGFQVLVQLGLLPFSAKGAPKVVSLTRNSGGKFINRWVEMEVKSSPSPFLQSLTRIQLPMRHGEGQITLASDADSNLTNQVFDHAPLVYTKDVNGSYKNIAALTNTKGNVFGIMPHPEAFVRWSQHPDSHSWKNGAGAYSRFPDGDPDGLVLLKNAAKAVGANVNLTAGKRA